MSTHTGRRMYLTESTTEIEETTVEGYRGYIERTIRPALGDELVERIGVRVLENLHADLRRCNRRCSDGDPAVDHRTGMPHGFHGTGVNRDR